MKEGLQLLNKNVEFLKKNPTNVYAMTLLSDIAKKFGYFDDAELLLKML